jgi:hypothetical protein
MWFFQFALGHVSDVSIAMLSRHFQTSSTCARDRTDPLRHFLINMCDVHVIVHLHAIEHLHQALTVVP